MFGDMLNDDVSNKNESTYRLGQDLALLSVEELDSTIEQLRKEIIRLNDERDKKDRAKQNATALFSFKV